MDKNNSRGHYNLGLLYEEQEKWQEAKKEFELTLQLDPEEVEADVQLKFVKDKIRN